MKYLKKRNMLSAQGIKMLDLFDVYQISIIFLVYATQNKGYVILYI